MEVLRLMVKALDVQWRELTVWDGKGGKDRLTLLLQSLKAGSQEDLLKIRHWHQSDVATGWVATISIQAWRRRLKRAPLPKPAWPRQQVAVASAIHLLRICWNAPKTTARSRKCWGIRM